MVAQEMIVVPTRNSYGKKISEKPIKRSFEVAASPKSFESTMGGKCSPPKDGGKTTKRLGKIVAPKLSKSPSVGCSSKKKFIGKITRKDLGLQKIVSANGFLPDGTELGYYAQGKKKLNGYKAGSGIFCSCCENVISASQFEAHACYASWKKPYSYIYTSNGVSLHDLSVKLSNNGKNSKKINDDGGRLVLCDGCPRAFHMECDALRSPPGVPACKSYCKYCQREKFGKDNANPIAVGRDFEVDPTEQITTRSNRIVNDLAPEMSSCSLCRGYDFSESGFGPRTIIFCDQCDKESH